MAGATEKWPVITGHWPLFAAIVYLIAIFLDLAL